MGGLTTDAAMPFLAHGSHRIRYEISGPETGPAYVLVNGLTQYSELWATYRDTLSLSICWARANPTSRPFSSGRMIMSRCYGF
jgi:hypothetical protein